MAKAAALQKSSELDRTVSSLSRILIINRLHLVIVAATITSTVFTDLSTCALGYFGPSSNPVTGQGSRLYPRFSAEHVRRWSSALRRQTFISSGVNESQTK